MPRIAAISSKQLGDVLLLQPALYALSKKADKSVALITKSAFTPLIELMPGVTLPTPKTHYDALWVFEQGSKAAFKALLTHAQKKHLILNKPQYRRWYHAFIFDELLIEHNKATYHALFFHQLVSNRDTFSPPILHCPSSSWKPETALPEKYILVNPTAAWESKSWCAKKWSYTMRTLMKRTGIPLVLVGGQSPWEREHTKRISQLADFPLLDLAGKTSLRELLYLAAKAHCILSIDGFIAHLGTAFRVPTLTLFGPTKWERWHWPSPLSASLRAADFSSKKRPSLHCLPENAVIEKTLLLLDDTSMAPVNSSPFPKSPKDQLRHIQTKDNALDLSRFPHFLIIGPQRTGTSWLSSNLREHPQIFLPREKEMYYFSTLGNPDHPYYRYAYLEDYLDSMQDSLLQKIRKNWNCLYQYGRLYKPSLRGEATATYARLSPEVIQEICRLNPDLKAILMLRHPIERAWSHAKKDLIHSTGRSIDEISPAEFEKFFRATGQRKLASYTTIIDNWSHSLRPNHLLLCNFKKIAQAPEELLNSIYSFLGVDHEKEYFYKKLLSKRVGSTGTIAAPDFVLNYLQEILADEIKDFEQISKRLPEEGLSSI